MPARFLDQTGEPTLWVFDFQQWREALLLLLQQRDLTGNAWAGHRVEIIGTSRTWQRATPFQGFGLAGDGFRGAGFTSVPKLRTPVIKQPAVTEHSGRTGQPAARSAKAVQ